MLRDNEFDPRRRQCLKGMAAGGLLMAIGAIPVPASLAKTKSTKDALGFALPKLPYPVKSLAPHISAKTLHFHYGKHHKGYLDKLNSAVSNTPYASMSLEDIVRKTANQPDKAGLFNNAAQSFNHAFYWKSLKPRGGGAPTGDLLERIKSDFGSLSQLKQTFAEAAGSQFGSGWAWLILEKGKLKVIRTSNADTPLTHGQVPLLTLDVWEHAYYLDYQNRRADYIGAFLDHLINWEFARLNMKS